MKPEELRNKWEDTVDSATELLARDWMGAEALKALNPVDILYKEPLVKDFNAVLEGVRSLIVVKKDGLAEEVPQKKNLYVWVERLTLKETLRFYETRPVED